MRISKYFRFTIKGDDLNPNIIKDTVNLPCDIFIKDEMTVTGILKTEILQKTNRWVYRAELNGESSVNAFLTKHLETISRELYILKKYIEKFDSKIEIIIYAGNKTDINLSLKQIRLLNNIGVPFSISFC